MQGAENGYTYQGAENAYHVTLLQRNPARKTARIKIESCLTGCGTIPNGVTVTVPLSAISAR